jgi:L-lactate dehydrogenase (cytochrome)
MSATLNADVTPRAWAATAKDRLSSRRLRDVLSLDDFERVARRHLPHPVFAYVAGGAETDWSLRDNRAAFADYAFLPRALVDVSRRSPATTLFGRTYAAPFGIAPMGMCALYAYRGDLVLARAAAKANVPMMMSGTSLIPLEDVARQTPGTWFQAYLPGTAEEIVPLVERVARAGFETLVITVDCQIPGNRENNVRAGFSAPLRPTARLVFDGLSHPRWLAGTFLRTLAQHGMPHFENNFAARGAPILSRNVLRDYSDRGQLDWRHWRLVRDMWKGTLVIKGILDPRDAKRAQELGADGVIVSNHGGRQLDGAIAPLRMLPAIVAACSDIPVMIDSGLRRGTDVLKALALGARFVFVGRPFGFAAAVAGDAGVRHAIDILASEIDRDMGMLGITRLGELDSSWLVRVGPTGA